MSTSRSRVYFRAHSDKGRRSHYRQLCRVRSLYILGLVDLHAHSPHDLPSVLLASCSLKLLDTRPRTSSLRMYAEWDMKTHRAAIADQSDRPFSEAPRNYEFRLLSPREGTLKGCGIAQCVSGSDNGPRGCVGGKGPEYFRWTSFC